MCLLHIVFVSYHIKDQGFRERFEELFSDVYGITVPEFIKMGDLDGTKFSTERIRQGIRDKYLRNSTVTVVLVGANTWQQKSVDWESAPVYVRQNTTPILGF